MTRSHAMAAIGAAALLGFSCNKEEAKAPVHAAVPPPGMQDAGAPEPLVEVPPAPEIPKAPEHLPALEDSKDNPTTPEKAYLGYLLFFDKRLSKDDSMACAGCHFPEKSFTDGRALSP